MGDRVPPVVTVTPGGDELVALAMALVGGGRTILGLAGAPGSGKSQLASALVRLLGSRAVDVPMDGFHLADVQLRRRGLLERKGAPETFDPHGYAALLARLRARPAHPVYAPGFERELEQPLAGAIAVPEATELVVTEGNYLLLDRPGWREVREQLDAVWYVTTCAPLRFERLVARHIEFGKEPAEAQAWVERVDEPNARLVEATRGRAEVCLDLTAWVGALG